MNKNLFILFSAAILVVLYMSVFTVHMTQSVVVLELQKPKQTITEPGLYFKVPFLEQIRYFSKQLLVNDSEPAEAITKDKKNLLVDSFSMWRIVNPLLFLQTVRDERNAQSRLDDIIYSELRVELGTHNLHDIVTTSRGKITQKVTKESNKKAMDYGIQVVDVRIKRTDLPPEIQNAIYNRMRTERQRIANRYRSEGDKEAKKIRAEANKQKVILMANAYKEEQATRGTGDAAAIKIYAEAYSKDPEFYAFIRSMEAYKNALKKDTTIILSEDSDFLHFLDKSK